MIALARLLRLSRTRMPRRGQGRAHALALRLAFQTEKRRALPCLDIALDHYCRAAPLFAAGIGPANLSEYCQRAIHPFDIDWLISFSDAWRNWEHTSPASLLRRAPLDQALFEGTHPDGARYHRGIFELAKLQRKFLRSAVTEIFPSATDSVLDLGSGLGAQARLLLDEKKVSRATCIDFPIAARMGGKEDFRINWLGGDLRRTSTALLEPHDVIWIGNVMHHYSPEDIVSILHRYVHCLRPGGRIIVQEYLAGEQGEYGLVAAIFGVHFALTTDRSRTFTLSEITRFLRQAGFARPRLEQRFDGRFSSLLVYRCQ